MIRNEKEYEATKWRVADADRALATQRASIEGAGFGLEEVRRGLEPVDTMRAALLEELAWYERVRTGDIGVMTGIARVGEMLIASRIAAGLSQRDLATRLGVSETEVSRDEHNEYHGATVERAQRVMDALGGTVTIRYKGAPRVALDSQRCDEGLASG